MCLKDRWTCSGGETFSSDLYKPLNSEKPAIGLVGLFKQSTTLLVLILVIFSIVSFQPMQWYILKPIKIWLDFSVS